MAVGLLAACGPDPATTPTPSPSASPADLTTPGVAAATIADLMAYAGSTRVINVEITRSEARLAVVTGQQAQTYAWRDGTMSAVDADTAYVGQAIFDPRGYNLADLAGLFTTAATISGSSTNQKLQIVDYNAGQVYFTVTTNPESMPVFFTTTGQVVPTFDPSDVTSLADGLTDVIAASPAVVRLGIGADGSVFADSPAGPGQIAHRVRRQQFPAFLQVKTELNPPASFDPRLISASQMHQAALAGAAELGTSLTNGFALTVYCPTGETAPAAFVTIGGKTVQTAIG